MQHVKRRAKTPSPNEIPTKIIKTKFRVLRFPQGSSFAYAMQIKIKNVAIAKAKHVRIVLNRKAKEIYIRIINNINVKIYFLILFE